MITYLNKYFVLFLNNSNEDLKFKNITSLSFIRKNKGLSYGFDFFYKKIFLVNKGLKFGFCFTNKIKDLILYLKALDLIFLIKINNRFFFYSENLNVFLNIFFFSKFFFIIFLRFFFVNFFFFSQKKSLISFDKNYGYLVSSCKKT